MARREPHRASDLPVFPNFECDDYSDILTRQKAFGYTFEDIRFYSVRVLKQVNNPLDLWVMTLHWRFFQKHKLFITISSSYLRKLQILH